MAYIYAQILKSDREGKKYMIRFYDQDRKQKKVIHFGAAGMNDFTKTKDEDAKSRYISRHRANENWNKPDTPGAASRWILWNKETLTASYNDYLKRFGLKKY